MAMARSYNFLPITTTQQMMTSSVGEQDFQESDIVWGGYEATSKKPPARRGGGRRESGVGVVGVGVMASSVPVKVPDWGKIYGVVERRESGVDDDFEEDDDEDERVPPHVYLAARNNRRKTASFSVHEGIGRTLKGRDLSRVRNAIWEKTGFQD